jgi:hypothetical protein
LKDKTDANYGREICQAFIWNKLLRPIGTAKQETKSGYIAITVEHNGKT